jgi:hypothetical protein
MTELPTALYDLVARLDHAAAVYNWPDCTEAAREIESLHAEVDRLRAVLQYLRDSAEASEDARYGTLSTKWVMGIARESLRLPARATDSLEGT